MVQEHPTTVEERPADSVEPNEAATTGQASAAETLAQAAALYDLSTPDGVKAAIEQFPLLKQRVDGAYGSGKEAGKSETELRYERDQASSERVNETAKQIFERYGVELDDQDRKTLTGLTRANADAARLEMMRNIALEAKAMATTESEATYLQNLIDNASSVEQMTEVATLAVSAVANRSKADAFDSTPFDEVLKHPKLGPAAEDWHAKRMAAELEARGVEAQQRENPPDAPLGAGGAAGRMTADRLAGMTPAARLEYLSSLDDEARGDMWSVVLGKTG